MTTLADMPRPADMTALRAEIDRVDRNLAKLLARRAALIARAAEIKAEAGIPARIPWRADEVIANARDNAAEEGVDPDLAERLWREIVEWSIAQEARTLGPD